MNEVKNFTFPGQMKDEEVAMIIRKHWFPHLRVMINFIFAWLIPMAGFLIIVSWNSPEFFTQEINRMLTLFFFLYLLFVGLILFIKWLNQELDTIIVTNHRIISNEQISFFQREMSESGFEKIQDVKAGLKGICSNIFQFGTLEIQTAAEKILFVINEVPYPERLCQRLSTILDDARHNNLPKNV